LFSIFFYLAFNTAPSLLYLWDWSGNAEQLAVKEKWKTKRRGKPAKLKDEKRRKNSRDERRRRKKTTLLVKREDAH